VASPYYEVWELSEQFLTTWTAKFIAVVMCGPAH
jgi:hypothetical protein